MSSETISSVLEPLHFTTIIEYMPYLLTFIYSSNFSELPLNDYNSVRRDNTVIKTFHSPYTLLLGFLYDLDV